MERSTQVHEFPPCFNEDSEILILGTFPSVKSREMQFYYGHPSNRFWRVLAELYHQDVPGSVDEKKHFLSEMHIALWDVIEQCEIAGSSDSSIKNVKANDISMIIRKSKIRHIFLNGKKAMELYRKYIAETVELPADCLPSTSPANAACSMDGLLEKWKVIRSG